jgi:hypothetical protein
MELLARTKWIQPLSIRATSSDGVTGAGFAINGYNRVALRFDSGVITTGDSDDVVVCTVDKASIATIDTDAAASDWSTITAATQTLGPSADSDTALTGEFLDIDLVEHGLSTGMLRVKMTGSLGAVSQVHCTAILYGRTGKSPAPSDSGAYTDPASS